MEKIACIATDFDFTLAHFTDRIENGFFDLFCRRGWSEEAVRRVRLETEAEGFSIEKFLAKAKREQNEPLISDGEIVVREFYEWVDRSLTLYPDSMPFLKKHWGRIPIAVITFGDQLYQRRKVRATRIPYNDLRVVTPPQTKTGVLYELLRRYGSPAAFIEDKPEELDAALKRFGPDGVKTFLVRRSDGVYNDKQPRYVHTTVRSLEELNVLLEDDQ